MLHVTVAADHDLVHTLHLNAGLAELAGRGALRLRYEPASGGHGRWHRFGVRLTVTHPDAATVRHVFDFHDDPYFRLDDNLAWCDLYWKANHHVEVVAAMPADLRQKVRPYGLYFPARSPHEHALPLRLWGSARAHLHNERQQGRRITPGQIAAATYTRWRRYRSRLLAADYRCDRTDRPTGIYFHPGAWLPPGDDQQQQTNTDRHAIITGLRREFGDRFRGGFVQNARTQQTYPDATYPVQIDHRAYVGNLHDAHIVISTNGIGGCHSWRTAEALAAGAILVTERPTNTTEPPLRHGATAFFYDTPDECVALCQSILSRNTADLSDLHRASTHYYDHSLAPGAPLLLDRLKQTPTGAAV